jgi:hypothetical protein
VRVADQLCAELPYAKRRDSAEIEAALAGEGLMGGIFNSEEEALVSGLRQALVRIAGALGADLENGQLLHVRGAIDGAEMATRVELMAGNAWHLPRLFPSFVFLVALPIVEQDLALKSHSAPRSSSTPSSALSPRADSGTRARKRTREPQRLIAGYVEPSTADSMGTGSCDRPTSGRPDAGAGGKSSDATYASGSHQPRYRAQLFWLCWGTVS